MYCNYFGLRESPFSIAPNPRYLFMSEQHQEALAHLLYGISIDGGFVLLTGEVGTGKTTVARQLLEQLPDNTDVALILNPRQNDVELLQSICDELGLALDDDARKRVKYLVDRIYDELLRRYAQGRTTVLMIDEAQQLPVSLLELIRLLTNLETSEHKLLKIILLGQPELLEILAREDLRQLSQRITARFHLGPLRPAELPLYIRHRLAVAGLDRPVFPERVMRRLYRLSGGLPRLINLISDRALLGAFVQKDNQVNPATLDAAAREVLGTPATRSKRVPSAMLAGVLVAVLLGGGAILMYRSELPTGWLTTLAALYERPEAARLTRQQDSMHPPITPLTLPAALSPAPVPVSDSRAPADAAAALSLNLPTTVASLESPSLQIDDAPAVRSEPAAQPDIWGQERDPDLAQVQAYRQLFRSWQLEYDPREQPVVCEFAASRGLGCLSLSGDVELLAQLDRPAVTRLLHRGRVHEVLVRQLDEQGALLSLGGEEVRLSRDAMAAGWLGEFTLLWRVPPDYREPLWPGAQGTAVAWLDSQLARAAGQTLQRPPRQIYDAQLVTQLRAFQQRHGLSVDGVAGPRTLIRLNSVTGVDQPRLVMR